MRVRRVRSAGSFAGSYLAILYISLSGFYFSAQFSSGFSLRYVGKSSKHGYTSYNSTQVNQGGKNLYASTKEIHQGQSQDRQGQSRQGQTPWSPRQKDCLWQQVLCPAG